MQSHILELPEEILRIIFKLISDNFTVGQVCKRFYSISCGMKAVRMSFLNCELDNKILDSVLNSGRKIEALSYSSYSNVLEEILTRRGETIKEVKIDGQDEFNTDKKDNEGDFIINYTFDFKAIELLNKTPNITLLHLSEITVEDQLRVPKNFQLQLNHLVDLKISNSNCVAELFNIIQPDVLEKLSIVGRHEPHTLLRNQRNIKHLEVDDAAMRQLDLTNAKIKTLSGNFRDYWNLRGQDELVSLKSTSNKNKVDINILCQELKSLESLELWTNVLDAIDESFDENVDYDEFVDLSAISKLPNLKFLKLFTDDRSLSTLESSSLEHLVILGIRPANQNLIRVNCPNVQIIENRG